jgi:N-acetylmuramoyl-L-alanine amidase
MVALNDRSLPFFSIVIAGLLIAVSVTLLSQTAPPPTPSIAVLSREGKRSLATSLVGDQEFVALDDLAAMFQLTVHEESFGAITVSYKGRTIILTPEQSLASVAGRLISLPAPPARSGPSTGSGQGRRWLVPVEFISRALAPLYDVPLDFRKASHLLVIGDLRVPRVTVRFDPLGASGRLTIDVTPRATATVSQEAETLTVRFDADALDAPTPLLPAQTAQSLVQGVRFVEPATLVVQLGPRFTGYKANSEPVDTTMRVEIDLSSVTETAPAAPPPSAPELPPALTLPSSPVRTITIDPGHGGTDEGVHGVTGAREKDVALAVARRAKAAIEGRLGVRTLLTRDDDRNVPIDERTAIANNNKADLFLSIHANASRRPSTAGASMFVAAFEPNAAQAAATVGGRVPTFGGGSREIDLVFWDFAQTQHVTQSTAFASLLEQQLHDRVPLAAQTVDRAPLRVLESANMPAVLLELGYLTNPDQGKLLATDAFQNAVVQALVESIIRFRDTFAGAGGGGGTR